MPKSLLTEAFLQDTGVVLAQSDPECLRRFGSAESILRNLSPERVGQIKVSKPGDSVIHPSLEDCV